MKKIIFTLVLLLTLTLNLIPQPRGVRGFVFDSTEKKPLPYAHIVLSPIPLNDFPYYTTTNEKGYFEFRRVQPGRYSIEITFIGFEKYIDTIDISWGGKNLDTIFLKQAVIDIGEIVVRDKIPQVIQKGDTLEFNAAAFQTAPNSTLEDLVLKLPGVEKEDNVIKVQGEEVKRILVDGRRFFGNDPEIALRNLPADIVERIQLFDKKSEQAELTGFEDEQTEKTFNVLTRVDKRKGMFGKFYGGYGSTDRFNSGANFNSFDGSERISLLGIANNINQSAFTSDDISSSEQFSAMPRGRWSRGRGGRNQNPLLNVPINIGEGNNDIYAFGVNYSNIFNDKLEFNGSYFFNRLDNINNTKSSRIYISDLSELDRYNEIISARSKNLNHRINLFIDFRPDSVNIFRIRPDLTFTTNKNFNTSYSENFLTNQNLLNSAIFNRQSKIENFDFSNEAVYSRRLSTHGRTISLAVNSSFLKRLNDYDINSANTSYLDTLTTTDTLNQASNFFNTRFTSVISLTFTETLNQNSQLRIRINPQILNEKRERDTYKSDLIYASQFNYDSLNSNSFETQNLALRGSVSYRYNSEKLNIELDLMYQNHLRKGIQKFPQFSEFRYRFNAILPTVEISYRPSEFERLRIEFNTRANIPSISQLQNTIDFSNPNFLRTGNPELNKVTTNNLNIRYFVNNPQAGTFNAYSANLVYSIDNISSNVIIFTKDTILPGNIFIPRGTQLSYPVNAGNAVSVGLNALNSFRLSIIKANLSFSTSFRYAKTPNLISGKENTTTQYWLSEIISLNSSIPQIDYRIGYSPSFTYSINSLNKNVSKIFIQRLNLNLKVNIFYDLYFGTKFDYLSNSAAPTASDKSNLIWNLSLSYLLLPNKSGELKLEVIDLLNQRKKIDRIIREDYYEDRTTNQLERFIILSFTYNLRVFR